MSIAASPSPINVTAEAAGMSLPPLPRERATHPQLAGARDHRGPDGTPYLLSRDEPARVGPGASKSDGVIRVLTLNRPKIKNGFDDWQYLAVADALNAAEADERVLVVVLTGSGDLFSSGADLKSASSPEAMALKLGGGSWRDPVGVFMRTMLRFPKLLVAAVNGDAIGIGTTLLAHCDLVYAVDDATLWTPFSRVALIPEFCSTVLFPRLLGQAVASEMLLMSKKITTVRAASLGFINAALPRAGFFDRVLDEVRSGLVYPLLNKSIPLYKQLMKVHDVDFLERVLVFELDELDKRSATGEIAEAVILFLKSQAAAKGRARM